LFLEKANLLVLNPPFSEKSLIIAIRFLKLLGSTAMLARGSVTEMIVVKQLAVSVATVAVGQMIRAGVRVLRGSEVSRFPSILPAEPFSIAGVTVTPLVACGDCTP
jgi:hypothetical protein